MAFRLTLSARPYLRNTDSVIYAYAEDTTCPEKGKGADTSKYSQNFGTEFRNSEVLWKGAFLIAIGEHNCNLRMYVSLKLTFCQWLHV